MDEMGPEKVSMRNLAQPLICNMVVWARMRSP